MDHTSIPYLREALVFLTLAGIAVPLLHRAGVVPTLGYLMIGIVIGPHGLITLAPHFPPLAAIAITDTAGVRAVAEIGVVLLLFMIGLELPLDRVVALRRHLLGLGVAQVVVTAALLAGTAWTMIGLAPPLAALVGIAFALSSTAVVAQFLTDQRRLATPVGRATLGVLLLQDLAIVPVLFALAAVRAGDPIAQAVLLGTGKAVAAIILIGVLGRVVLRPLFRIGGMARGPEAFLALAVLVVLAAGAATGAAGLSMALGAFLAGILIAGSEYRHAVEAGLAPLKGFFLGLFFAAVGLQIDVAVVWRHLAEVAVAVVALYLVKGAVVFALARASNLPTLVALEVAILLGQVGEFAFLLIGAAASLGDAAADLKDRAFAVAGVSLLLAPAVFALGRRIVGRLERGEAEAAAPEGFAPGGHVVIAGYGRVGQILGLVLEAEGVAHVAFDADPANVAEQRRRGRPVWYGDARHMALMRNARLDSAQALVIAIDEPDVAETIATAARAAWPDLAIVARARDVAHATRLLAAGAGDAVPENLEASLSLARRLLEDIGVPDDAITRRLDAVRGSAGTAIKPHA